jgi:hypothetical protein
MKCKSGYYYCYTDKECKKIPAGLKMAGKYLGGGREPEEVGIDKPVENGNGNGNGGGVSESKSGDSSLRDWFGKSKSSDGKPGWVQLGGKYSGKPCAKQPGQTTKPKCGSSKMKSDLSKDEEETAFRRKNRQDPNPDRKGKAKNVATEETVIEAKGEKDACYHKVKSRYSVWPSAYASGALVKCRKKGAANWGNSTKKEEFSNWREELLDESGKKCWKGYKKVGTQKLFGKTYNRCVKEAHLDTCNHTEKGIECPIHGNSPCNSPKSGPKGGSGGKIGPNKNYVKPMGEETIELTDAYGETFATIEDLIKPEPLKPSINAIDYEVYDIDKIVGYPVDEAVRLPSKTGNIIIVSLMWRGKYYSIRMFFPSAKIPTRSDVQYQIDKVYPGAKVSSYSATDYVPGNPLLHAESSAWTKKEGKNKSGGLNEKGRKSYERENPGSDLKAPSKKVGNPRRASFCARMKGMKKKLTSKKTASDPDSRINKSLRAWNC